MLDVEMLILGEVEEAFFDTSDHLISDEGSDYDIWLREPQSVSERRGNFLSRMGFESDRISEASIGSSSSDSLLLERRNSNSQANCSVDYFDRDWLDDVAIDVEMELNEKPVCDSEYELKQQEGEICTVNKKTKKVMSWLRSFTRMVKKNHSLKASKLGNESGKMTRVKMDQNRKSYMECTGVYAGQEVRAHNGLIWTMKFSPDGQYIASGGEDGLVLIWRVTMVDASCNADECSFDVDSKLSHKSSSIIIPEKIFHLEEEPLHRFMDHSSDVLDLAWSPSNHLLSSSMDKTVRLWHVDSDKCLGVYHHSNYVTCVQFNPVDESYFVSGSIDGKVRVWGIHRSRVEQWANVRDIVTAVCYQPNGKGFVVGTLSGNCRFYESSGDELVLNAEMNIHGKRRSSGNKITGIQFLNNDSRRLMITSEDSKIRILDGLEIIRKYKGLTKSGSQMSASFTSSGRHIVSIGEDSRVYLWNYIDLCIQTPKQVKSTRSCESFFSKGVSVVLPWSDLNAGHNNLDRDSSPTSVLTRDHLESSSRIWDSKRFSLANWFSMDGSSRATSITWPEEKLPLWDSPSPQHDSVTCGDHFHQLRNDDGPTFQSTTWGLVFVTANLDGTIKTFHNYGLPVRV